MPSVQIRDILTSIRSFYHRLADAFEAHEQRLSSGRLPFLLEYIADHERQLEAGMTQFEDDVDQSVLDTWLQFGADETLDHILEHLDLHPGMTEDDVLGEALRVDSQLITLYDELAGESSVPHVQELFAGLAKMQEARERQLARAIG